MERDVTGLPMIEKMAKAMFGEFWKPVGGRQKAENRKQKTENRKQKTENRKQKTEKH
jgi:hypothetical protein